MQAATYFDLAEFTRRHLFLTGKAGTGKTTFLHHFIQKTKKQYIVVAPTGIAAINAGGVTIHSLFGLPLTTFAPTTDYVDPNEAINIPNLLPHFKYRREKLQLLRALEILIIDEVSMLRCDVLDMIDLALRSARRSTQKFGGVQLLLIGDLYQLPPVVKQSAENSLYQYYATPFFFSAKALAEAPPLTITLEKVYRQTDARFLHLLNAIRNRDLDSIDFGLLESRYHPQFEDDSYIQLVSHNYIAQQINENRLRAVNNKAFSYTALITGDFKEPLYPTEEQLIFKEGARVMFIRNDTSEGKRYFNGMLATVSYADKETIKVNTDDTQEELELSRETWENKKYITGSNQQITEDIIGTFEQYPIRLAWAVTIHKSQGLTFDKVIIDAGRSFTSGQVYVALSRCRTLEGVVLKSRITQQAIQTNEQVALFHQRTEAGEKASTILEAEKYTYATEKVLSVLDTARLQSSLQEAAAAALESSLLLAGQKEMLATLVSTDITDIAAVYQKFTTLLSQKVKHYQENNKGWNAIEERCSSAVDYFYETVAEKIYTPLSQFYGETKGAKGLKGFNEELKTALQDAEDYLTSLKNSYLLEKKLLTTKADIPAAKKVEKIPSHIISYRFWEDGLTIEQIAATRSLTPGTIYSHLTKMAGAGILDLERLFAPETVLEFEKAYPSKATLSLTDWKNNYPSLEFHEIRLLLAHCQYKHSRS